MRVVLVLTAGEGVGRQWTLSLGERARLGRGRDAEVRLRDPDASREHAQIACTEKGALVVDLGSRNGTFLGGELLAPNQPQLLTRQTTLRIGAHVLEIQIVGDRPVVSTPRLRDTYDVFGRLGEGAAGTVYAGRHKASGREVAIKGLHDTIAYDPRARERFLREGRVRVQHPNVVQVLDVVVDAGRVYVVMELLKGGSVRDLLRAQEPIPLTTVVSIAAQAARGIEACHNAGIIHRDIKPANLLLSGDGTVKIADFGIAKQSDQVNSLTVTGQGMGTLAYIAPEQATDAKRIGGAADLYSLGATLYHLLAGRAPFVIKTVEIIFEIINRSPDPVSAHRPDCPPALAELVHDLLAKDPDERPPEARGVVAALEAMLS